MEFHFLWRPGWEKSKLPVSGTRHFIDISLLPNWKIKLTSPLHVRHKMGIELLTVSDVKENVV